MPIVDPFDRHTTNTGIIDPFDAPKPAQLKIKDPFDTTQKPSFLKSALKAPLAGVGDAIEMYSRALRTTDPEGGWDVVRNIATKGVDLGKSIAEKFPTENEDFGLVKRGVVGGIRSSVPSVAAGVPGAIIGTLGGIPGGIVGGYAGSGAIITGAAEYDRFLELADQYGIPKEIARSGAIKSALVEGGIEGAANALDAILLKAGSPVVSGFKQFAKNALKIGGVESGTEAIQAALEAKIARDVGIPAPHPLEAAKEAVIPALTMGGIIGAGGTMANKMLSKPVKTQQTGKQAIIDPFDNQVKPPQIQQIEKQEVVLPPGEKPFIQPPQGFVIDEKPIEIPTEKKETVQPVVNPPEGFVLDKPIQPLPQPENVEIVKPQPKGFKTLEERIVDEMNNAEISPFSPQETAQKIIKGDLVPPTTKGMNVGKAKDILAEYDTRGYESVLDTPVFVANIKDKASYSPIEKVIFIRPDIVLKNEFEPMIMHELTHAAREKKGKLQPTGEISNEEYLKMSQEISATKAEKYTAKQRKILDILSDMRKNIAQEDFGRSSIEKFEAMEEATGFSPKDITNEFINTTYSGLDETTKKKFDTYISRVYGEPDSDFPTHLDVLKYIIPKNFESLEGTERGLYVLMDEANKRAKNKPKGFTPIEAAPVVSKEPWQMTSGEYLKSDVVYFNGKPVYLKDKTTPSGRKTQAFEIAGGEWYSRNEGDHKYLIKKALSEGKPVPPEVLKDYPELQQTHTMPSGEVMPGAEHKEVEVPIHKEMLEVAQTENIFKQVKKITSAIKIDKGFFDHFDRTEVRPIVQKSPGLFSTKQGMPLDEVADGLGISTDELASKLRDAISKKAETEILKKQIQEYRPPTPQVTVAELGLKIGDKFKIHGEQYTVKERDAEGNFIIEDGDKFVVDEFDQIPQPDEGSIQKSKVKYSQPKMFEGEKTNITPKMEAEIQGQQKMFEPKGEIVKEPTGTADAGGYVPTKEQTQYAGAERQAQELPEVVELYNEISKGKYPAVERYMKDKLGYFSPKKGKIGLRQDLPIGERIELTPHIEGFKNVLITVPDLSIRKGDIAIERDTIAVSPRVFKTISQEFENYMRKESGLTDEEIAFRKDFNKKTRMYELRAYKRDKTLALKVLSHEAFHYVDYLPDQAKRGNVLGHVATLKKYLKHMLDTFPTSAEADINETKIELRKQSLREAKGQPEFWKAANQRYKELLAQELSTREVITKQEVMAELKALTQKVKPFDDKANPKFKAYRYSPKELYADAGGALLWNPKLLQETAPKFYKSFFAYLERKPEAKQTYDAIQNKLGMIPGLRRDVVIQDRIRRMKEGYERGRKARKEMEERRKTSAETIMDTILNQAVDDEHANLKRIRKLEKGNESNREIGRKARLSIEELKMIDSKVENYVNHFTKEVDAEMLKNNITLDDMGVLAQAARVIEERSKLDIFNPGGETLETSREMLSHLQQSWGREKFSKVAELFAKFQQLRQRFVMPALEEGKRYDPELIEYAKNNLFYTRFSVSKYLTERFGGQITGTIYKQYGTLSEIESPIEATIIQDIMLIRAAKVNELKLDMVEVLKRTNELTPAEIDKSTNKWQPKPPPDQNNYGVFTVMRDGKAEHYYVDKQIVDSFQFEPFRAKQIASIVHMISEPFRRLFVTRNPRWMFKNPIRDIKTTIKQVPEIKLRNIPEFMLDYGRGVKEAFSDVFMGKRSEDISKLMEGSGLIAGRYYDQDNFETKIEELQSQFSLEHHPKKVEGAWNRLKRVYQIIDHQFDKAGRVSDISTKIAGYKYLKKHSTKSEREIMHDVRTLVGTPNARRQGRLRWLLDNMFMFSGIGKEGLRSSWESYRTKPTAYLWKTTALNVLPLLTLLGAGAAGVEWVKKILEELSQYDLESKTIIPTPYTVNNKPVAIAIPEDYQGMVVRKLVFNIMNKDVGGSLKALWDAKPYQWHPMIKIGNAMFQYYILGNNPKDTFRNRDIIPRDRFEVGGLTASKALLKHTWNELGGSLFYRFPYDDVKEDFKSVETLKKIFPMNALGDFLIISNEGIKQSSYEIQDRLNQAYEKRRFEVKQEIKKNINSSDTRKTDKEILKELYIPLARKKLFDYKTTSPTEFINKYRRLESKKEDNPYLDSLENAHRNEVKEALLNEYSQKLSRKELLQLLSTALKEKIITDEFTRNYLIKRKAASSNR